MKLITAVVLSAVAGLVIGELIRRRLNRLTYRLPASYSQDRDETVLASPGPRRWIPVILAAGWASTALSSFWDAESTQASTWVYLLGWMIFCGVGMWLSVIDLDVQRLPDRGQLVLGGAAFVCGIGLTWGEPTRLLAGLGAALGCGLAFTAIHIISKGALGLGDVKLVMTCGWWLGIISLPAVFTGLLTACLLAIAVSIITRKKEFAFGPWLVTGTLVAGQLPHLIHLFTPVT
ncbi:MAG: prepilin peptidase [Propionibacteriaceae bacterium]|nr:prepilin peptidase [Propionibacteriaceae bacterium]